MFSVFLGGSGIAEPYGKFMFNFLRNSQTLFKSGIPFYIPTGSEWGFHFLHILDNLVLSVFSVIAILVRMCQCIIVVLVCSFLKTANDADQFSCAY